MENIRTKILKDADRIVNGKREEQYGKPEKSFDIIGKLWTIYLNKKGITISPIDVAVMMSLLKIARISGGNGSLDSFIDIAGYAACAGEIYVNNNNNRKDLEDDISPEALEIIKNIADNITSEDMKESINYQEYCKNKEKAQFDEYLESYYKYCKNDERVLIDEYENSIDRYIDQIKKCILNLKFRSFYGKIFINHKDFTKEIIDKLKEWASESITKNDNLYRDEFKKILEVYDINSYDLYRFFTKGNKAIYSIRLYPNKACKNNLEYHCDIYKDIGEYEKESIKNIQNNFWRG